MKIKIFDDNNIEITECEAVVNVIDDIEKGVYLLQVPVGDMPKEEIRKFMQDLGQLLSMKNINSLLVPIADKDNQIIINELKENK